MGARTRQGINPLHPFNFLFFIRGMKNKNKTGIRGISPPAGFGAAPQGFACGFENAGRERTVSF
jgi:hypothetical protein